MDSATASETLILIVSQVLDICVYASSWGSLRKRVRLSLEIDTYQMYVMNINHWSCALITVEVNEDGWTITNANGEPFQI